MDIREVTSQQEWENLILPFHPQTFLQSWEWGQLQQKSGETVKFLCVSQDNKQLGAALVTTVKARRGWHYHIPHGPLAEDEPARRATLAAVVHYLRAQSIKDKMVALRVSPLLLNTSDNLKLFRRLGFQRAPMHVHADYTWVLDTDKSEAELLANMRKTTRHAIGKAQQAGVQIEIVSDLSALDRFWQLYIETSRRHDFVPWSYEDIELELKLFGERNRIFAVFAQFDGVDVAAAICPVYGESVFYHHGASRKLPGGVPAAQLVQWAAIAEAKRRGAKHYNFWGIAPENKPHHPFAGITTFKKGFGGYAIDYLHAQDLPLSAGYWKLWAVDMYRKLKRGF